MCWKVPRKPRKKTKAPKDLVIECKFGYTTEHIHRLIDMGWMLFRFNMFE
jgi:hypothetical protein